MENQLPTRPFSRKDDLRQCFQSYRFEEMLRRELRDRRGAGKQGEREQRCGTGDLRRCLDECKDRDGGLRDRRSRYLCRSMRCNAQRAIRMRRIVRVRVHHLHCGAERNQANAQDREKESPRPPCVRFGCQSSHYTGTITQLRAAGGPFGIEAKKNAAKIPANLHVKA